MSNIKNIKMIFMLLAMFCLLLNTGSSIDLKADFNENRVKDTLETGWFIYPLLNIYRSGEADRGGQVEDWEISVCMYLYDDRNDKTSTYTTSMANAITEEYPGMIASVTGSVEKNVIDPDDLLGEKTNKYTTCWSVLTTTDEDLKYTVYLQKGQKKIAVVKNEEVISFTGTGNCDVMYSDLQFEQVRMMLDQESLIPPIPIMDYTDPDNIDAVEWEEVVP